MLRFILCCLCLSTPLFSGIEKHYKKVENKTDGHSYGAIDYVYVINLDHRTEKYEETMNELTPYGIHALRFSAVYGWKLTNHALQEIGMVYDHSMRGGAIGTVFRWADGKEHASHELINEAGTTYYCHCMPRGAIGCLMSHVSILRDAYDSGYEIIWIMEDDIEVVRDPSIILTCIQELDRVVGRNNWDILFTDRDYRDNEGGYILSHGTDYRPDVETRNQAKYNIDRRVSAHVRQIGSRFGTHSMVWSRPGMKKYLDYIEKHGMYLPIDMDMHLAPQIKLYSVVDDVVTNRKYSVSDNGNNENQITAEQ